MSITESIRKMTPNEAMCYDMGFENGIKVALETTSCITLDRLRELVAAERDGRVVVLPCKVGDAVYAIADCADILKDCDDDYYTGTGAITCPFEKDCEFEECDDANRRIFETYVGSIYKDKDEPVNIFLDKIVDRQFYPSDFGKTVFLTRAEAEQALVRAEAEAKGEQE